MADIPFTKLALANGTSPVGISVFQPIEDALDAIAHKANRGSAILESDMDSSHGIGTFGSAVGVDLDTLIAGGFYFAAYNAAYHFPAGATATSHLLVVPGSSGYCYQQLFDRAAYKLWYRTQSAGTWTNWACLSDGLNGVQPPAPKPQNASSAVAGYCGSVAGYTTPNVAGAVYLIWAFNSSGNYIGMIADRPANYDCRSAFGATAAIGYYRTA